MTKPNTQDTFKIKVFSRDGELQHEGVITADGNQTVLDKNMNPVAQVRLGPQAVHFDASSGVVSFLDK